MSLQANKGIGLVLCQGLLLLVSGERPCQICGGLGLLLPGSGDRDVASLPEASLLLAECGAGFALTPSSWYRAGLLGTSAALGTGWEGMELSVHSWSWAPPGILWRAGPGSVK